MTKDEEVQSASEERSEESEEQAIEEQENLLKRLKYLQAEFENYKKRVAKEMAAFAEYSNGRIISTILPIVDDLEKAGETMKNKDDARGVRMIYENFMSILKKEGLEEVGEVGEKFDPFKHECVSHIPSKELDENLIAEVVQKGYIFKSKVLRPSKVVVVKNQAKEEENGKDNRNRSGNDKL